MRFVLTKKSIAVVSLAVAAAIVLSAAAVTVKSSAAESARLFTKPTVQKTAADFESDFTGNSADRSHFSAANNAGAGYVKAAETNDLELYYKESPYVAPAGEPADGKTRVDVALYDKRAKHLWNGILSDGKIDYQNLSDAVVSAMQSLVTFTYVDFDKDKNAEIETNPLLLQADAKIEAIRNGVRLDYNITELSMSFAVDLKISGDNLDVSVPQDQIREGLENYDKITKSRKEFKVKVNDLNRCADTIKDSSFSGVSEGRARIVKIQLDNLKRSLLDLSDEGESGQSTDITMNGIQDSIGFLDRYLGENAGYTEVLKKIHDTISGLNSDLVNLKSNRLCGLVELNVLPYFGAAGSTENGYAFYPDGSGAISYYNQYHPLMTGFFKQDVYSNNVTDLSLYDGLKYTSVPPTQTDQTGAISSNTLTSVAMPVFGMKNGDSAFASIIAQGDSDAAVAYYPATPNIAINHVNASFKLRAKTQNVKSDQTIVSVIDNNLINQPRMLRYVFLSGNQADYSGMAVSYRKFLEKYGLLSQSTYNKSDTLPLGLEFFMGIQVSKGITSQYKKLTSYADVENILKALNKEGVKNINGTLRAWSDAGFYDAYPDKTLSPAGGLGGKAALRNLTAYASHNNDTIGLETQYIFGNKNNMPYGEVDSYTVKNYGGFPIEYYGNYLYNPIVIFNRIKSSLSDIKSCGVNSLTLNREGSMLYGDYNAKGKTSRSDAITLFRKASQQIKDSLGYVNYDKANVYMANVADWMLYLPETDSKYLYSDEAVPFYQIVLHGSIPYTGQPFNMMHDTVTQKLRYIEYGYLPFYELTKNDPSIASGSDDVSGLFSTVADDWLSNIVSTYNEYSKNIGGLWKVKIMKDEKINDTLSCVTYENGCKIYVNYAEKPQQIGSVTIPAQSYRVVKG